MFPSIAQLVERWTVVVICQGSIGRWFKSGSKEFFYCCFRMKTFYYNCDGNLVRAAILEKAAILFSELKAAIC